VLRGARYGLGLGYGASLGHGRSARGGGCVCVSIWGEPVVGEGGVGVPGGWGFDRDPGAVGVEDLGGSWVRGCCFDCDVALCLGREGFEQERQLGEAGVLGGGDRDELI